MILYIDPSWEGPWPENPRQVVVDPDPYSAEQFRGLVGALLEVDWSMGLIAFVCHWPKQIPAKPYEPPRNKRYEPRRNMKKGKKP